MQDIDYKERDEDFVLRYEDLLVEFFESNEEEVSLEPMNSYYRRLVHNLAKRYKYKTHSEGEGDQRHIVLTKTPKIVLPERIQKKPQIVWDFGEREYFIDPLNKGLEVFLGKDGSIGIYEDSNNVDYITKKKVYSNSFKIRRNKIDEIRRKGQEFCLDYFNLEKKYDKFINILSNI